MTYEDQILKELEVGFKASLREGGPGRFLADLIRDGEGRPEGLHDLDEWMREYAQLVAREQFRAIVQSCWGSGHLGFGAEHEGQPYRFVAVRSKTIHTLLGPVELERAVYAAQEGGSTWVPLDERLGWPGGKGSVGLKREVSRCGAVSSFEGAAELLKAVGGIEVSASTVRRICGEVGEGLREQEDEALAGLAHSAAVAKGKTEEVGVVEADAVSVPLREGWEQVEVGVVGKMQDSESGPRWTERVYAGTHHEPDRLWRIMQREARRMGLEEREGMFLSDGARVLQDRAAQYFPQMCQGVDYHHVAEHLHALADLVFGEGVKRSRDWAGRQKGRLRRGGVEGVERAIADLGRRYPDHAQACAREAGYFRHNRERMRYVRMKRRHFPIGSGAVEGACKHIVTMRFKGSGCRWSAPGLRRLLPVRLCFLNRRERILIRAQRAA